MTRYLEDFAVGQTYRSVGRTVTEADIMSAIDAGASGYLLKDAPPEDLFRAIRGTARGETVLAPAVAAREA